MSAARSTFLSSIGLCALLIGVVACQKTEAQSPPAPEGRTATLAAMTQRALDRFDRADTDHDGKITLSEAEGMALKHFDEMDSNHDGQVTREERGGGRRLIIKEIRKEVPDEG